MQFTTLADLVEAYLAKHLRFGAESTRKQYRVTVRNLAKFLGRVPLVSDLTDETVADVMAWFLSRGRTSRGANKVRSNLHTVWSFACRHGWIGKWPDTRKLVEPERIPVAWSQEELRILFRALSEQKGEIAGIPAALWWHGIHAVQFDTAERIGAILQLPWNCVSLASGTVTFRAETRKGRRRDTQHRLHPETVALLERIRTPKRPLVFPWPHNFFYLWNKYRRILTRAGLPADRAHMFHAMRRTVASLYSAAGHDATMLLDHSNAEITRKHYLAPEIVGTQHRPACDVLFRP